MNVQTPPPESTSGVESDVDHARSPRTRAEWQRRRHAQAARDHFAPRKRESRLEGSIAGLRASRARIADDQSRLGARSDIWCRIRFPTTLARREFASGGRESHVEGRFRAVSRLAGAQARETRVGV